MPNFATMFHPLCFFSIFADVFRTDFDLEKHLPDELDLLPNSWPNLDTNIASNQAQAPQAPQQQNIMMGSSQNVQNPPQAKFPMQNGESQPHPPQHQLIRVSLAVMMIILFFDKLRDYCGGFVNNKRVC